MVNSTPLLFTKWKSTWLNMKINFKILIIGLLLISFKPVSILLELRELSEKENGESTVREFLASLNLLINDKTATSVRNCKKLVFRPNESDMSAQIYKDFGVPGTDVDYIEKNYIGDFLGKLKRNKTYKGNIIINDILYCESYLINNEERHRVSASVEIENNRKKITTDLLFVLKIDALDDIRETPFKIYTIMAESCTVIVKEKCTNQIATAQNLITAQKHSAAMDILQTLDDCTAAEKNKINKLKRVCENALLKETVVVQTEITKPDREPVNQDAVPVNQDAALMKEARNLFANGEYKKAKNNYLQVKNENVAQLILNCENCIIAERYLQRGDALLRKENEIAAYNTYLLAESTCKNTNSTGKVNQIRNRITSDYLENARLLMRDKNYLDALDIIRQVYAFDAANAEARKLEAQCKQYNNPDFIVREIQRAKKLFSNVKASPKENAEAFRILYSLRDSKYMDGEAYAYLVAMEYQPKKYKIHRQISQSIREIKAYWGIHLERGINLCKNQKNCNADVNYFLGTLEEELLLNRINERRD